MNSNENKTEKEEKKKSGTLGEIIRYLIIGGLVTLGQLLLIALFDSFIPGSGGTDFAWSNLIAGFIMMFVAFFPYKIIVFRSKNWDRKAVFVELVQFVSARIFTVLFDIGFVALFVVVIGLNNSYDINIVRIGENAGGFIGGFFPLSFILKEEWIVKFCSLAITTVLNFLFSKLIVFKDKKGKGEEAEAVAE